MKMEQFELLFEARLDMRVLAPVGTSVEKIREIITEILRNPSSRGWELPNFEAQVTRLEPTSVLPDKHSEDDVVLSDDSKDLVLPCDAKWWR